MKNEELLRRHGSQLNPFTTALRDACLARGKVAVRMRNGDLREVGYVPPEGDGEVEHPYDCPNGGFRSYASAHYWLANGESITGDRFDLVEFEPGDAVRAAHDSKAKLDAETLTRLRRVMRLLGIEDAAPEDNPTLAGSLFSVFGRIGDAVERLNSKK
jgi:hypothetical protein